MKNENKPDFEKVLSDLNNIDDIIKLIESLSFDNKKNFLIKLLEKCKFTKEEFFSNKENKKLELLCALNEKGKLDLDCCDDLKNIMDEIFQDLESYSINKRKLGYFLDDEKENVIKKLSLITAILNGFNPDETYEKLIKIIKDMNKTIEKLFYIKNSLLLFHRIKYAKEIQTINYIIDKIEKMPIKEYYRQEMADNIIEKNKMLCDKIREVKDLIIFSRIYKSIKDNDEESHFNNAYKKLEEIKELFKNEINIEEIIHKNQNIFDDIKDFFCNYDSSKYVQEMIEYLGIKEKNQDDFLILMSSKIYEKDLKSLKYFFDIFPNEQLSLPENIELSKMALADLKKTLKNLKETNIYDYQSKNNYYKIFNSFYEKKEAIDFLKTKMNSNIEYLKDRINPMECKLTIRDIDDTIECLNHFKKINELTCSQKLSYIQNLTEKSINKFINYSNIYPIIIELNNDNKYLNTFDKINKIIHDANFTLNINSEKLFYKESNNNILVNVEDLINLKKEVKIKQNYKKRKEEGEKDLLEIKIEKLLFFKKLVSNLEEIYKKLKILRIKECLLPIEIKIKIQYPVIEYYLNKELTFEEIIIYLSEVIKDYEEQLNEKYKTGKYLRFLYGKLFSKIFNHLNINFEISDILRYILNETEYNNKIQDGNVQCPLKTIDYVNAYKLYNSNILENIRNYICSLFHNNKKDLTNHYKEMIIFERNKYKGIYLHKCKDLSKEEYIVYLFYEKIGRLPIAQNILICNKETSIEEIQSFLYRALLCDYNTLFIVEINESFSDFQFNKMKNYINESLSYISEKYKMENKNINSLKSKNCINSCLVFVYDKDLKNKSFLDELKIFEADELNDSFNNIQNIQIKFDNVKVISSDVCGLGKTHKIKKMIKEENKKYYHFPLCGKLTKSIIYDKLLSLFNNIKNKCEFNIGMHIDLYESENISLINEFLFSLIITKFYINNGNIIYIPNNIKIYIEIPNTFDNYLSKIKILNLFNIENIVLGELKSNEQKNIINIKMDKLELEPELIIIFNKLLGYENNEQIENFIKNNIGIKEYSYYQVNIFIKLFISQLGKFDEKLKFIDTHQRDITEECIKNFAEGCKYFINNEFTQLLMKGQNNSNFFDLLSLVYENNIKKYQEEIPLIFIDKKKKMFHNVELNNINKGSSYEYLKALKEILNLPNEIEKDSDDKKSLLKNDEYIITNDIFKKLILIIYRINANIPVILMGEIGSGKTALVKKLNQILNNGEETLEIINIHPGINEEMICECMKHMNKKAKNIKKEIWIIFDELNTCLSYAILTEIFINRTFNGEKIEDNIRLIGSCNPYRRKKLILEDNTLIPEDLNEDDYLVYKVKQLPQYLLNYVFSFGSLADEDEKRYIYSILSNIFNKNETKLHELTTEAISECHKFLRNYYNDPTISSLREIARFRECIEFFEDYFIKKNNENEINDDKKILYKIKSIICSLYCCYYIKIISNEKRAEFDINLRNILIKLINTYSEEKSNDGQDYAKINELKNYIEYEPIKNEIIKNGINNFSDFLNIEEEFLLNQIVLDNSQKQSYIGKNSLLKENLFISFLSIITKIPLIIIGKPGTSKNLAVELLFNSMNGELSKNYFFKKYPKIYQINFQGSKSSSPEDIENLFNKAKNYNKNLKKINMNKENLSPIILILFDKLGLAAQSPNNPLKVLHSYFEYYGSREGVSFIGISNYYIDITKRALILPVPNLENDLSEIKYTSKNIVESISPGLIKNDNFKIYEIISETYYNYKKILMLVKKIMTFKKYIKFKKIEKNNLFFNDIEKEEDYKYLLIKDKKINIDFHGNIDFYHLIKNIALYCSRLSSFNENEIISIIENSIERNFGGIYYDIDINLKYIDMSMEKEITKVFEKQFKNITTKVSSVYLFKKIYNNICKEKQCEKYQIKKENLYQYNIFKCLTDNKNDLNSRCLLIEIKPNVTVFLYHTIKMLNPDRNIIFMDESPYLDDINKEYKFGKINEIANELISDKLMILQNLEYILPYLSDLCDNKYKIINSKKYIRMQTDDSDRQLIHINDFFKLIILTNNINLIDISILNKFEKMKINFNDLLNQEQKLLSKEIIRNIELKESISNNNKINYDLKELLINCGYEDIAGLVYISSFSENKKSEIEIEKNIFSIISDILPQDIITILDEKNIIKQTYYKEKKYFNLKTYLQDLESNKIKNKISIIYTFNNIDSIIDDFNSEMELVLSEVKSVNQLKTIIDDIKNRNNLNKKNNKNIILIHCNQNDINKLEYIFNSIKYYYGNDNYFYIFINHIKRSFYSEKNYPMNYSIPYNDPYIKQIFIDNLNGNSNISLEKILKNNLKDILFEHPIFDLEAEINKSLSNILDDECSNKQIKLYLQKDEDFKNELIKKVKDLIQKSEITKKDCKSLFDKIFSNNIIDKYTIDIVSCFINYIKEIIIRKNLKSVLLSLEHNNQFNLLIDIKNKESDEVKDLRGKILSEIKIDEFENEEENKENENNKEKKKIKN